MEPWDAESQLLEQGALTPVVKPQLTTSAADCSGFLPFSDEFYWEKQCDEALSEEAAKSLCDDDDFDEIVNVEPFDGPTPHRERRHNSTSSSSSQVFNWRGEPSLTTASIHSARSQLPVAELSDVCDQAEAIMTTSPQDDPTTATSATESLLPDSRKHYNTISAGYTLFGGSSTLSMEPEKLVSSSSPSPAINGIPMYRTHAPRTYHSLGKGTGSTPTTDVPGGLARAGRACDKLDKHREHVYSSSDYPKYEIGIRNINKTYLNRLNVVLSLMLVICSVIGIALFLFYMLSCNE